VLSAKGPRKMTVVLPRVTYRAPRGVSAAAAAGNNSMVTVWRPVKPTETLFANYRATCTDSMMVLQNKPPKWNEQVGAYVLNFGGRVTMASVKNFQLMSPDDPDTVVLQFGRTGKDHFTMDFSWPLNLYQAFCICVSSLDNKLACE
jgi:tubby-related protein 1